MEPTMTAVELLATVDENQQLQFDQPLPIQGPMRVRVIVLYPRTSEIDEIEWLRAATSNAAFYDLQDPAEDIYSSSDGKPFDDQA